MGRGGFSSYKASYTWHTAAYACGGNTLLLTYAEIYSTNVGVSEVRQASEAVVRKNFYIDYFIYLPWARTQNTDVWLIAFTLTTFKTFKMQWDLWHWEWDLW